jgi:copper chaperone
MGFILNAIISQTGWTVMAPMMHEHSMLPGWLTWSTSALLSAFMIWHLWDWVRIKFSGRRDMSENGKGLDLIVEGMNCSHCVRSVTESLKSVPGVNTVNVTLENGLAHVEGENLDKSKLEKAVIGVGYKVKN